ncbi:MAG: protein translocase subunit SecD [Phycisphaerae bacterium]
MPENLSGRLTLIFIVLWVALSALFPTVPGTLFWGISGLQTAMDDEKSMPAVTFMPNLNPGIDMAGGISLLYEIQQPEGGEYDPALAERVAEALKRRVDPQGVKNLIWRPSGANRLEVQKALSGDTEVAAALRETYTQAQRQLEEINVSPAGLRSLVMRVANSPAGSPAAQAAVDEVQRLAFDSPARQQLVTELLDAAARLRDATGRPERIALSNTIERLAGQVTETNLPSAQLEAILEAEAAERETGLGEIEGRFAEFPEARQRLQAYVAAYDAFAAVRDQVDDAASLKALLRGSGVLEFHMLATVSTPSGYAPAPGITSEEIQQYRQRLQEEGPRFKAGDRLRWFEISPSATVGGEVQEYAGKLYALTQVTPEKSMVNRPGDAAWGLQGANAVMREGSWQIDFTFDAAGGERFSSLTARHLPDGGAFHHLAVVLDDELISAPRIQSQIGSRGQITGDFTADEANFVARTLNAGSAPARLSDEPIRERNVGPQLGEDNLRSGLIACVLGLFFVLLFMTGYYFIAGAVAGIAVLINIVIILGMMAALDATFTLPAVAGIVLTIGMSVDANVLIFERYREEKGRGLSTRVAMKNAYDKAFSAIVDGSITTAITSIFLYWLGNVEVKGFGLTLIIGLASSLFTSLFVTKTIFAFLIDRLGWETFNHVPDISPRWNKILNPSIDWVRLSRPIAISSGLVIVIGLTLFGIRFSQGKVLDIEFTSGVSAQFRLTEPMPLPEVRRLVDEVASERPLDLPSPSVVSVGEDNLTYEVVTPSKDASKVAAAVVDALEGRLAIRSAAVFTGFEQSFVEARRAEIVMPITEETDSIAGFTPARMENFIGGTAVVLRDLELALSPDDIRSRVDQARLEADPNDRTKVDVVPLDPTLGGGGNTAVRNAVVYLYNNNLVYSGTDALAVQQWADEFAAPKWSLVASAVATPTQLESVNRFDAQVAQEAQRDGMGALLLSLLGIVLYVWVRFGNLRFGMGAIVALLHDAAFVLAAVGFAHYLSMIPFIANTFALEPFRLNLTLLAALLTTIGYSVNDTVVVFDRIRENRGKFGHLDRAVINISINQTLSRTLLTGGTTFLTLIVMYIFGGPGIHGFTYAMLIGIIVGTYSSIAIAAPITLIGYKGERVQERALATSEASPLQEAGT